MLDAPRREQLRAEVRAREDAKKNSAVENDISDGLKDGLHRALCGADVMAHGVPEQARRCKRPVDDLHA